MKNPYKYFSERLIQQLEQNEYIREDEIPIVRYSLDYLVRSLLYHLILLLIGICFGQFVFSIVYILTMGCLKHFTGGAHAPNALICSLLSYSIFLVTMYLSNTMIITSAVVIGSILSINILLTLLLSPIECRNKRFNREQRTRLKCITTAIVLVMSFLLLILFIHEEYFIINIMLSCMSINTVNLIVGYIINKKEISDVPEYSNL